MRRITRQACEDGPVPEEQETEGQRQLHSLLRQQLHTEVDIGRCVAKRKCFAPAALYKPFGAQAAGVRSLAQFQALQAGEQEVASLRELGLTDQEMELWRSKDLPEAGEQQGGGVRAAPGARRQRLQAIREKVEAREELMSRPQRLSASRPLSRREMEIERALFHGSERLSFLSALYHQEDGSQAVQGDSSYADGMDLLYREVLREEEQATAPPSAKCEGRSMSVFRPEPEISCNQKQTLEGLPAPRGTDTQTHGNTDTDPGGCQGEDLSEETPRPAGRTPPLAKSQPIRSPGSGDFSVSQPIRSQDNVDLSVSQPIGSLNTVASSMSQPIGSLNTVAHSVSQPIGSLNTVAPSMSQPIRSLGTVALTGSQPIESLGTVALSVSQPIGSLGTVARPGPGGPLTVRGQVTQVPEEEIRENRETEEGIRRIPRFQNYQRGEPSQVLCVRNLSPQASLAQLVSLFSRFQPPDAPPLLYRLLTGRLKGLAFITFSDAVKAEAALDLLNGYRLLDKPLVIEFRRERRDEERERGVGMRK